MAFMTPIEMWRNLVWNRIDGYYDPTEFEDGGNQVANTKIYKPSIDKPELIEGIAAEAERRGVSRPVVVADAVEMYLQYVNVGSRTQRLIDEKDKLQERLTDAKDRVSTAEGKSEVLNNKVVSLESQNRELTESRNSSVSALMIIKKKIGNLSDQLKALIAEVRSAQDAGMFGRGAAVKNINLAKYQVNTEEDNEKTG